MGKMTNLISLRLDYNLLEGALIGEIRQMSKLETIDTSYIQMTGVPAEIGQLKNLRSLNLSNNLIMNLPNELANIKANLKDLDLSGNPLSQEEINRLKQWLPNTNIVF